MFIRNFSSSLSVCLSVCLSIEPSKVLRAKDSLAHIWEARYVYKKLFFIVVCLSVCLSIEPSKVLRAKDSLAHMGSSVCTCI